MKVEAKPLSAQRKQLIALGVVGVLLCMVLYWQFGPQASTTPEASNSQPAGATGSAGVGGTAALPKPLELGKLDIALSDSTSARNPFKFYVPPPPPPPPRPPASSMPASNIPVGPPPGPPPPPPVPPIPLKYIGTEDGPLGKLAILSDGKGSVMSGKEGEVIDGQYRIVKIGMDTIIMEYVDGTGRRTIRSGGS